MTISIISIFTIGIINIKKKNTLKSIYYLEKNIIELFIISNKTLYVFIYEQQKIIK